MLLTCTAWALRLQLVNVYNEITLRSEQFTNLFANLEPFEYSYNTGWRSCLELGSIEREGGSKSEREYKQRNQVQKLFRRMR